MDVDPSRNTVVFEFEQGPSTDTAAAQAPTRAEDGVEQAWQTAAAERRIQASQVRRVYSEWEPTSRDAAFIKQHFPTAEVTFSFARPDTEEGWEQAIAEAQEAMRKAMVEQMFDEAQTRREEGQTQLLPVLRDFAPGDVLADAIVHRAVGPSWAVFLAHVGPTERGTIGTEYVMKRSLEESPQTPDELFEAAWQNLAKGLKIEGGDIEGVRVLQLSHPLGFAASALALPNFLANASSWMEQPSIFAAFPSPDTLLVTAPDTPVAEQLRESVVKSDYWGSVALTPACLVMDATGMRVIDARKAE